MEARTLRALGWTLVLLAAAEGADMLSTWYGMHFGGTREINPATLAIVALGGWTLAVIVKLAVVPGAAGVYHVAPVARRGQLLKLFRLLSYFLFGVALGNVALAVL
jgi:hypothetical protein